MRHLIVRLLFAAALLFAQQVGFAHALTHGSGHAPSHQHSKGLPMQGCDDCVAFAQVQGAPGTVVVAGLSSTVFAVPDALRIHDWTPVLTVAFSPRGPPRFS